MSRTCSVTSLLCTHLWLTPIAYFCAIIHFHGCVRRSYHNITSVLICIPTAWPFISVDVRATLHVNGKMKIDKYIYSILMQVKEKHKHTCNAFHNQFGLPNQLVKYMVGFQKWKCLLAIVLVGNKCPWFSDYTANVQSGAKAARNHVRFMRAPCLLHNDMSQLWKPTKIAAG